MTADGITVIDKPAGMTSHDVVNKVRRLYGTRRVGHTGTLDPDATGVLVVLVGRAAKACEYVMCDDKRYEATLILGITTDTEDASGTVLTRSPVTASDDEVRSAAAKFTGKIKQVPPMYSALKRDGRKLADLARRGITVEREARDVTVYEAMLSTPGERFGDGTVRYGLSAHVSKGTYIRTLCADIGAYLGCGAVMGSLRRIESGGFSIESAHTLEELEMMSESEREACLMPTEELFANLPKVKLPAFFAKLAHCGNEIYQSKIGTSFESGTRVRLCDDGGFFALGEVGDFEEGSAIRPIKQFRL